MTSGSSETLAEPRDPSSAEPENGLFMSKGSGEFSISDREIIAKVATPCRPQRLTSLALAQQRRRNSIGTCNRFDQQWPTLPPAPKDPEKEGGTPSTRTPSSSPRQPESRPRSSSMSYGYSPLSSVLHTPGPGKHRRHSKNVPRSNSEALSKQCQDEAPGLEEAYWKICAGNSGLDCRSFDKFCKEAGFLDLRFTTADADLIFHSVMARGPRRLDAQRFETALRLLADRKCLPPEVLFSKVKQLADDGAVFGSITESFPKMDPRAGTPGSAAPTPIRRTPSLALLETPPRHRNLAAPTVASSAAAAMSVCQRRASTPSSSPQISRPRTAPRSVEATRDSTPSLRSSKSTSSLGASPFSNWGSNGRLQPLSEQKGGSSSSTGCRSSGQAERELLLDTFNSFCWGREGLDGRGFSRLCRDCRLVDSRFTALDADLLFTKVLPRGHRRMDLEAFEEALEQIAERRGATASVVRRAIAFCPGPLVRATQTGMVRLHDDRGGYTGTHALGGPEPGALGPGTVASLW
eukprot:TRINITY_DN23126_c5_g1_i1.p1 TRINITY_DN23126_c5_g1~~TRINITY_DN23126_c5_g1_i1.p1  ORF type:complete len:521 (-),score=83.75 TRINITY_DN23126_c5_g1_i1:197-1759(-)